MPKQAKYSLNSFRTKERVPIDSPMKDIDPALVIYTLGGFFVVFATFIVLTLFTEGVKSINEKMREEERKKKEDLKKRNAA